MTLNEIEFTTHVYKLPYLYGMHYMEIPKEIVEKLGGTLKMRLVCTVNQTVSFQGGLMALGNGDAYVSINVKRMKQLKIEDGDEILLHLKKDESKYGMDVPPELNALLEQDPEGFERFEALTPGKQRYIIHYVASVKSSQKRIDRAILLISNLKKLPRGKEEFRAMLGLE